MSSSLWRRRWNRSSVRRAEAQPMNAVAVVFGRGTSFSTAAVMMPSVPSEPTKRFLRS